MHKIFDGPNMYSYIVLFCIVTLFETAFLGLTIPIWDTQSIIVYLILAFALQMAACIKAICIWYIHRHLTESVVYIACAVISSLIMYLSIEISLNFLEILSDSALISINSGVIALIDALLSVVLLYGLKAWFKIILKSEPLYLSSQIRHHFLFNTLNTTVCRIDENPRRAQVILVSLAELFRKILFLKAYISLEEELASVKCYLEIEKYRLGRRLQVNWLFNYNINDLIKLPALILQPLVENAIYHGIEKIVGGGTILISLRAVKDRFIIQVCNPIGDASYFDSSPGNNIAQANIERRLTLAYGDNFSFKQEQCETEYRVTINIPIQGYSQGGLR